MTSNQKPQGRRRSVTTRERILEAAVAAFVAEGYNGASMDDLARSANVAKPTLYAHFDDKAALYGASIEHHLARKREQLASRDFARLSAEKGLKRVARALADMFGRDDDMLGLCKMSIAGTKMLPSATEAFLRAGPWRGTDDIAYLLRVWTERGELAVEDPGFAARQLAELCKTGIFDHRLFGRGSVATEAECERAASQAVIMFLARYGSG